MHISSGSKKEDMHCTAKKKSTAAETWNLKQSQEICRCPLTEHSRKVSDRQQNKEKNLSPFYELQEQIM